MKLKVTAVTFKDEYEPAANSADMACMVELTKKAELKGERDDGSEWSVPVTKAHLTLYLSKEEALKFRLGDEFEMQMPT